MQKHLSLLSATVLAFVLLAAPAATLAQMEAPFVINQALADLSARLGEPVTLASLWAWRWQGNIYPDTSLGCPQPGETYAQVPTGGIQFVLDYRGVTYDYRVSTDGRIVVLCETSPPAAAAPETAAVAPVMTVADACAGLLPPRLTPGAEAVVSVPRLNLRDQPNLGGARLTVLPVGSALSVLGGPSCDAQAAIVWWQVAFGDLVGWAAESRGAWYYISPTALIEPAPPAEPVTVEAQAVCPGLLLTRLAPDRQALVALRDAARLNMRAEPDITGRVVGIVPDGGVVTVLEGPACGAANIWWRVAFHGLTGWVAENDGPFYILEPVNP